MMKCKSLRGPPLYRLAAVVLAGLVLVRVSPSPQPAAGQPSVGGATEKTLELIFAHSAQNKAWVDEVTARFNRAGIKSADGRTITVQAVISSSADCIHEVMTGKCKAHLICPPSSAFILLGNEEWKARTGMDLIGPTQSLMRSPFVIAMWRPMAEVLGWGKKPIGWEEILKLAQSKDGWGSYGHPEWGAFKFGHTHPDHSNSGLLAVAAMVSAAQGKTKELNIKDLQEPKTIQFLTALEGVTINPIESTASFSHALVKKGLPYLHAAVLSENLVVDAYEGPFKGNLAHPLVSIYPKEGTFWSDYPVGIVQREWVSEDHKKAAKSFIDFLLKKQQQQDTLKFGFRPCPDTCPLEKPLDPSHGVDPREPNVSLEMPSAEVLLASIDLWRQCRRPVQIVLVFDRSRSMSQGKRLPRAKRGASDLIALLADQDSVSLVGMSDKPGWIIKDLSLTTGRDRIHQAIWDIKPETESADTALYDTIGQAYDYLEKTPRQGTQRIIIVLSVAEDIEGKLSREDLLEKVRAPGEQMIPVFTIAYGGEAGQKVLKKISDVSQGRCFQGRPETIRAVFREIGAHF